MWESGTLNTTTPKGLLNAAFYTVGKMFCLKGGQEHRFLKLSQIVQTHEKYIYYENISKNHNGSFKQLHVKSKVVPLYPCPDIGERCPVYILDKYISKLPDKFRKDDFFYARPLEKIPDDENAPWYAPVPLGKHTLQSMVQKMCTEAKIEGCKTNHSLRATAATQMFQQGAPEKLIQERTGHRSLEGLRSYERCSENQHRALSIVLSSNRNKSNEDGHKEMPIAASSSMQMQENITSGTCTNTLKLSNTGINPNVSIQLTELQGCTITINNYNGAQEK